MKKILSLVLLFTFSMFIVSCKDKDKDKENLGKIILNHKQITITANSNSGTIVIATLENIEGEIIWFSSNTEIATVTPDTNNLAARIRGVNSGTTKITASIGDIEASVLVIVEQGEYLTTPEETIRISPGTTKTLLIESHTTNISYQSSNNDVVVINQNGLISAIKEGSAIITVKASTKTLYINVIVETQGIDILEKNDVIIRYDEDINASLTAIGRGGVDISKGVWTIDDELVAEIRQEGSKVYIKALETGLGKSTLIRFKLDGYDDLTRVVSIKEEDLTITLNSDRPTLGFKESELMLTYVINPKQPEEKNKVKWEVSPAGIVIIDEVGRLTRNPFYEYLEDSVMTTITVQSLSDPDAKSSVIINVENPQKGTKYIYDIDSFNSVMKSSNLEADIYLTADIDLEGSIYNRTILPGNFRGHFHGNGYTISNFSAEAIFGSISGTVENLGIQGVMIGTQKGLLAERIENGAIVKNLLVDVTFSNSTYAAAIALLGNASNVIVITSNPNKIGLDQVYAFTVQSGTANNVFFYDRDNETNNRGGALKRNKQQMEQASTFKNFDSVIWDINDGRFPNLKKQNKEGNNV